MRASGKQLAIRHVEGPQGVRGRNSDNALIAEKLGWRPDTDLDKGIGQTYAWIEQQVRERR